MAKKPTISFAILSCSFLLLFLVSLSDARSASSHPDGKILLPTEKLHESSVPSSSTAALNLEEDKHPLATQDVPDRFDGPPGEEEDHEEPSKDGNVLTVRHRPMKMRLDQPWMVRRFFHRRFTHGQRRHPFENPHHHHHHHHHHANWLPAFARVGILAANGIDLMFGEPHHYRHHHHPHFHHHDDDHHFHRRDDDHHFHRRDDDHMMMMRTRRNRFGVWKKFKKLLTHF